MSKVVRATVKAVKGTRKFVPTKAAVVMVSCLRLLGAFDDIDVVFHGKTPAAVSKVRSLMEENPESVSQPTHYGSSRGFA